jgi:hypothetical protein
MLKINPYVFHGCHDLKDLLMKKHGHSNPCLTAFSLSSSAKQLAARNTKVAFGG